MVYERSTFVTSNDVTNVTSFVYVATTSVIFSLPLLGNALSILALSIGLVAGLPNILLNIQHKDSVAVKNFDQFQSLK